MTNAAKHFKWEPRGKRRLHKKPTSRELSACRPWLHAEVEAVRPGAIVCLGASAAQQLFGRRFRLTRERGEWQTSDLCKVNLATWHASAVLRAPTKEERERMRRELVADLAKAADRVSQLA